MSGYLSGTLAILCINLIFAYGVFIAGLRRPDQSRRCRISGHRRLQRRLAFQRGGLPGLGHDSRGHGDCRSCRLSDSFPVLRTRGVYMVLATFAFGEVVAGFLLRSTFFGGAIGMVVPAHVEIAAACRMCDCGDPAFLLSDGDEARPCDARPSTTMRPRAIVIGVNVRAVQVAAFTIGGAFAGLSGALYAHNFSFVEAQYFNSLLSIYVLLFVLIGGVQTAWGPLVGTHVLYPCCRSCCASADRGATLSSASPSW